LASSSLRKCWYRNTLHRNKRHGSRISHPIRFPMKSRRQTSGTSEIDRVGMMGGGTYLGFQEIWREWCGYTTGAGYTELPLPPPPEAPPTRTRRKSQRGRASAGGRPRAHGELAAIATERSLTHSLTHLVRRKRGEGVRRRAMMRARRRRVARWNLEVVATFRGGERKRETGPSRSKPPPHRSNGHRRAREETCAQERQTTEGKPTQLPKGLTAPLGMSRPSCSAGAGLF
jgi:hypothetical protein